MNIKNLISCVGKILKIFPAFVFIISFANSLFAKEIGLIPDFAFPKTVASRSDSLLKIYVKEGDGLMALRETMNFSIATSLLDGSDSGEKNVELFEKVAQASSGEYRRLAYLILAEILYQQYSEAPGIYDSRRLPANETYPSDPKEWSGEMYRTKIYQLVSKATEKISGFNQTPISEISPLICDYKNAEKINLTLQQFIAFKGAGILENFSQIGNHTVIPFYPSEIKEIPEIKCEIKAKELFDLIYKELSEDNSEVKALALIQKLNLLTGNEQELYLQNNLEEFKSTAGEGLLLYEEWKKYASSYSENDLKSLFTRLNDWVKEYPQAFVAPEIKYAISDISLQRIETDFPKISLSGVPIKGSINVSNITKGYLLVYKLEKVQYTLYDEFIAGKLNRTAKPVQVIEIDSQGTIPFSYKKDVEIQSLSSGLYVVIPSKTKVLPKGWSRKASDSYYSTIRVSDISILTFNNTNEKNSGRVYVVKANNQQPVAGATVAYYSGNSKIPKAKLITNKEGWVNIPEGYYRLKATYGKSVAMSDVGFGFYPEDPIKSSHVSILTDLSVYKPGDTLNFALVGWVQDKFTNSLLKNEKIEVKMRDVNYKEIVIKKLQLNEEGRTWGFFVIPEGLLLGNYTIEVILPDLENTVSGYANFLVEEYKLPAFSVTLQQIETKSNDKIIFKGSAKTYSGMPEMGANVNVKVEYHPWRWGYNSTNASYVETLCTDDEGDFLITLPVANLEGTSFRNGRYSISAEVTTESGESEKSSPVYFTIGKGYEIRPSISDKIRLENDNFNLNIPVYDMAGLPVKKEVQYKITNVYDTTINLSGSFVSPTLTLLNHFFPSGRYKIEFTAEDAESVNTETVLWREGDKEAPYPTPLWIPLTEYYYGAEQKSIPVTFGSYWEDWLLYVVSDGDKVLETKWLSPAEGIQSVDIEIPDNNSILFVSISGMHDHTAQNGLITIKPEKSLEKIEIFTESFRDKLNAGEKEEWTFNFRVDGRSLPYVNALAVMTDKALNSIIDFKWDLNLGTRDVYSKVNLYSRNYGNAISYKIFNPVKSTFNRYNSLYWLPEWQTYDYPLISTSGVRSRGPVMYKMMASKNVMTDMVAEVAKAEASDESIEESEEELYGNQADIVLRPVEMPLAFFKPDLKGDVNGNVSVKFTVPNFNTTWQFQLAGYNNELLNASIFLDAVASKPVMVKTNLPQFLRTGDHAEISATIFNNSDTSLNVGGKIELFDPLTGKDILRKDFGHLSLDPSENKVLSLRFEVPDNVSILGIRAYALSDSHTDGEQGYISVFPSFAPVIESTTFYASSTQEEFKIKVPKLEKNSNVTLKYCDNPLWEILLSLPSMKENSNGSSLSISQWLFSTLLSKDIIQSNRQIAEGLRHIIDSSDSTLRLSPLQKDASIKQVGLSATPWINNAESETAGILSLGLYLDETGIDLQIEKKIETLCKMQQSDGGFSWFPGMQSSSYITSQILHILGFLNNNHLMPVELKPVVKRAIGYYDQYLENMIYGENKKDNFPTKMVVDYFYARNMFDIKMSNRLKKIESQCMDSIMYQWRQWDLGMKAKAGLVLSNNEKYKFEAQTIVASMDQFIDAQMSLANETLILELIEKANPNSFAIEKIKEKIFLQKETMQWSSDFLSAGIIYNLTKNIVDKEINRKKPDIYIGNEKMKLPVAQTMTGNFTINLDARKVSGKNITIKREAGIPAWGGVISQYIKPIKTIKASQVENLSIEKNVYLIDEKGEIRRDKIINKGDKVLVSLSIECGKDMDYVVITDSRAACLQPTNIHSGYNVIDGIVTYQEINRDKTSFFIEHLKAGKYIISYECNIDRDGDYSLGSATIQSLYTPQQVAHSAGKTLSISF